MEHLHYSPQELSEYFIESGQQKAAIPPLRLMLLAVLAGAFIAFACEGSSMAAHSIASAGPAKALAGALFSTGLMMVLVTGAQLFTGNILIVVPFLQRKVRLHTMLVNWLLVYIGNFIGSMLLVALIYHSGQLNTSGGLLGGYAIKTAVHKTEMSFTNAFALGVMCNWLVCMAVWMAGATKDIGGKLLAIFFPIWLFITSGFEHSVANMYYIPIGILAKTNPLWAQAAFQFGVTPEQLEQLHWGSFALKNLLPVTLGNIVAGGLFVAAAFWLAHLYKPAKARTASPPRP